MIIIIISWTLPRVGHVQPFNSAVKKLFPFFNIQNDWGIFKFFFQIFLKPIKKANAIYHMVELFEEICFSTSLTHHLRKDGNHPAKSPAVLLSEAFFFMSFLSFPDGSSLPVYNRQLCTVVKSPLLSMFLSSGNASIGLALLLMLLKSKRYCLKDCLDNYETDQIFRIWICC